MENLMSIVSQNDLELYNIIFKHVLPLPIVHEATNRTGINDDIDREDGTKEYPEIYRFLWAGSKREGLIVPITANKPNDFAYLLSDYDLIAVLNGLIATDGSELVTEYPNLESFQIKPASHPGYVKLISERDQELFCMRYDEDCSGRLHFMRNNTVNKTILVPVDEIVDKQVLPLTTCTDKFVHGPALCYKIKSEHPAADKMVALSGSEVDVVLAVRINAWPKAAKDWPERHRNNNWPSKELTERIMNSAIHLVPAGHPKSNQSENEWRFSFTIPERLLAQSLNVFQRACYILAKILLKTVIAGNEGVSSYLLKTQLFWLCEEIPQDNWNRDKMGYFVMLLLHRLQCSLKAKELKHFFIPENNMIDHVQPQVLSDAVERLSVCIRDPLSTLFNFTEQNRYFGFYVNPPKEIYNPLISLSRTKSCTEKDIEVMNSIISCLLWEFVDLYASWLKKDIAPPGDRITRPFAELKFRLLLEIATDIQIVDKNQSIDDIIKSISKIIEGFNVTNAAEFTSYAKHQTD